jgi:D-alanine-D-alanine ligase
MAQQHIAVLMGGWSAEREVSLTSGKAVAQALAALSYKVTAVDVHSNVAEQLTQMKPDLAFNALHGRWGEDGCIQGLLECLKIPYTHSGVLASALAMDKPMAKKIFAYEGLKVAEGKVVHKSAVIGKDVLPRPYVVKPVNEGSSVGVKIILEHENFFFDEASWPYGDEVLVESFVGTREVQVAVLDGKALGAIEIRPKGRFYDYEAKYTDGKAEHLMPAPIAPEAYKAVCTMAERAHNALGCRGLTRSDFRYDDSKGEPGVFYILELNSQPGMTPLSLSPEIAKHAGIEFNALVDALVKGAKLGS